MTDDIRRRAACDRCHSQKIRCPRQPGQAVCSRCVKAGTQCIFSPFRQKKPIDEASGSGRTPINSQDLNTGGQVDANASSTSVTRQKRRRVVPEQASTLSLPAALSESPLQSLEPFNVDDLGLDWLTDQYPLSQDFLVDPMFNDMTAESQDPFEYIPGITGHGGYPLVQRDPNPMVQYRKEANLSRAIKSTSALLLGTDNVQLPSRQDPGLTGRWMSHIESPQTDPNTCMQRLSQLSSDLFEHSQSLPPLSIHDPTYVNEDETLQSAAKDYTSFVIEDTFRHTQTLIDVYPSFLVTFLNHKPSPLPTSHWMSTTPSDYSTDSSTNDDANSPSSTSSHPKPPLDHASILLILSCHLRLISIYEQLFRHMDVCIKNNGIALTKQTATLTVPKLAIGTYCPSSSSAVPMQMLLLIQFASQLFNYASDLAEEIEGIEGGGASAGETTTMALTKAAAVNVKERAGNMTQELGTMRGMMLHSGMLA